MEKVILPLRLPESTDIKTFSGFSIIAGGAEFEWRNGEIFDDRLEINNASIQMHEENFKKITVM
jgi:hypothetical protein